jgi:hypothetical protein
MPPFTWKFLKPHMLVIIQEILYPLLCHTDEDEDLFENDPIEYIKTKYGKFLFLFIIFIYILKTLKLNPKALKLYIF